MSNGRIGPPWWLMGRGTGGSRTVSGAVAHWNDKVVAPLRSLLVGIEPVQAGTGDPSPDNVRPISGWSEVNVWRTGKNLLDKADFVKGSIGGTGVDTQSGNRLRSPFAPIKPSTGYWMLCNSDVLVYEFHCYDKDKKWMGYSSVNASSGTVTTLSNSAYAKVLIRKSDNSLIEVSELTQFILAEGTAVEEYVPYSGNQYTIQLGDTYYGGTLDVTNGVLTVDRTNIASYNGETLPGEWKSDRDVYAPGTTPTTGAQVVYELATPITIPLTPTEISTLQGQNNLWADSGDVTVTYLSGEGNPALVALALAHRIEE